MIRFECYDMAETLFDSMVEVDQKQLRVGQALKWHLSGCMSLVDR